MMSKINKEFNPKSFDQQMLECPLKRTQNEDAKWNLERKSDGTFVSDIWFDNLGTWSSYSCTVGNEHDILGWDGLIFLEKPRPAKGVYPFIVKSKIYHYSSEGELLCISENDCGIWGYGEKIEYILKNTMEEKKKLSYNIERTSVDMEVPTRCHYVYKFVNNQWLESIDNFEYFGIDHNSVKQILIDNLVNEFRISLNNVVFGDPAGKDYVESIKNNKKQ
jgi:hypothetical protein